MKKNIIENVKEQYGRGLSENAIKKTIINSWL